MSQGLYTHRIRNAGEIVTDTLYNTAHKNHQQNDIPNQAGALSDDLAEFQTTIDPAPGGTPATVLDTASEFEQLRFTIADIKTALNGGVPLAEWYIPVDVAATTLRGRGARVYRNTSQSIPLNTATACIENTVRYDTGVTDPSTDPFFTIGQPTRLTAKVAGLYQLNGFVEWDSISAGPVAVYIRLNGTKLIAASRWNSDGAQIPWLDVSSQYLLSANEYAELVVLQQAGNPYSLLASEFGIELLNPTAVIPPATQFTLSINESGTGSGVVTSNVGGINCPGTCAAVYAENDVVVLTATPSVGGFTQWSGDVPVGHEMDNPLTVTMDQARAINAEFIAFTLNIVETGTGSGIVTSDVGAINCPGVCSDMYAPGDIVQLTAVPTAGVFAGWTGDLVSTTNPDSITMDADKSVTANFELTGVMLGFSSGGTANFTGTAYMTPAAQLVVNATLANAQFKLPIDIVIERLSVTHTAALAGGHTVSYEFNIGGVDDGTITILLIAGNIDGAADGSITVPADTLIAIKAVQSGGGGDNIQSLTVVYRPV